MSNYELENINFTSLSRTDNFSGLSPSDISYIYNFVIKEKCLNVLEIGMADGLSSLTILSALKKNSQDLSKPNFKLTSIDPYQTTQWKSNGLKNIKKLNFAENHKHIEDLDIFSLPKLVEKGMKYDLIFIDGYHTFDHVLLNNFYADYLLNIGGFIINDDFWMQSIQKVCDFLTKNYTHFQIYDNSYSRFGPVYKKVSNKDIKWDEFMMF